MACLCTDVRNLSVGDTLFLPYGRTATVLAIKNLGPRARHLRFRTEFGWTRVELDQRVNIEAKVL